MAEEQEKEGIDLDAAYQSEDGDDSAQEEEAADVATPDDAGETEAGESAEGDSKDDDDSLGLGDLMDIFTDEGEAEENSAGALGEFLEELSMDQVAEEADRLLEEFRAI